MPTAAGLYFAQFDDGQKNQPPVILIHGAGSSHLSWPAEIRRLPGQRVLAVDLPGHGRSSGVALQNVEAHADQLVEFLAAIEAYQAVFIGHSMGGAVALDLAARYRNHTAGLGLVSSGAWLGVDPLLLESFLNAVTAPIAAAQFMARAFAPGAPQALVNRCLEMMLQTRPSVLSGDWRACAQFDLRETAHTIDIPTWIIHGSEDRITPIAYAHFLAENLPAARLQAIPGAGHMALLEQPGRVAQGLNQFLAALTAARFAAARVQLPIPVPVYSVQEKNSRD